MTVRTTGRCKATGKIKFFTRLDALIALGRPGSENQRCYHCSLCTRWHLTSMPATKPGSPERAAALCERETRP